MPRKKYGLDVVVPKPDTKAGPGLDKLRATLGEDTEPLAAFNVDHEQ
ncbi:hypothetical protein IT084_14240 [Desulfallas sp. Bu1-1]|jgi:hypothetical protein|nr:hypothetical protein [Desulfallas sp. Bu1-1]MBF7084127.1 hypothetical protein [Desulfallas sp. Bu1-1]